MSRSHILLLAHFVIANSGAANEGPHNEIEVAINSSTSTRIYRTVIWRSLGQAKPLAVQPFRINQWLPGCRLFIVSNGDRVMTWNPRSGALTYLITLKAAAISVDAKLSRLAAVSEDGVEIYSLNSKKLVDHISSKPLRRKLGFDGQMLLRSGTAWSPNGQTIAFSDSGKCPYGSSDGSTVPECFLYSNGGVTHLGPGAPISWISDTELLCERQRYGDLKVQPEIVNVDTKNIKCFSRFGSDIGWDGEHILVGNEGTIDEISINKVGAFHTYRVPSYKTNGEQSLVTRFVGFKLAYKS